MSAKFITRVVLENLNVARFTKELDLKMRKIIREGARRFMLVTLSKIPVDTGFLRGSFMNLEYLLGSATVKQFKGKDGKLKPTQTVTRNGKTYERFVQTKGAKRVSDLNEINRLERRLKTERRRRKNIGKKAVLTEQSYVEARKALRVKFHELEQQIAALELGYKNKVVDKILGRPLTKAEYLKQLKVELSKKKYKTLLRLKKHGITKISGKSGKIVTLKGQHAINEYIARLVEAKYNRSKRANARIEASLLRTKTSILRLRKLYVKLAKEEGYLGKRKGISEKEYNDLREEARDEFKQLKGKKGKDGKRRIERLYHYDNARTNHNPKYELLGAKKWYYFRTGLPFKVLKTPNNGRRLGTPVNQIFSFGYTRLNLKGQRVYTGRTALDPDNVEVKVPLMTFNFNTDVKYLSINDRKLGWNAWEAGMAAYLKYVTEAFAKESRIEQYLNVTYSQHGDESSESQARATFRAKHKPK